MHEVLRWHGLPVLRIKHHPESGKATITLASGARRVVPSGHVTITRPALGAPDYPPCRPCPPPEFAEWSSRTCGSCPFYPAITITW